MQRERGREPSLGHGAGPAFSQGEASLQTPSWMMPTEWGTVRDYPSGLHAHCPVGFLQDPHGHRCCDGWHCTLGWCKSA